MNTRIAKVLCVCIMCFLMGLALAPELIELFLQEGRCKFVDFFRPAAAAAPNLHTTVHRSKRQQTVIDLLSIKEALAQYRTNTGSFPLCTMMLPLTFTLPQIYYHGSYQDQWGQDFQYVTNYTGGEYTLLSYGKDQDAGVTDSEFDSDIVLINDTFTAPAMLVDDCSNFDHTERVMRSIGNALGAYQVDKNLFPYFPNGMTFSDAIFSPYNTKYYIGPSHDAWNVTFHYISHSRGYTLTSYGKDRQPGWSGDAFDSDILFINAKFIAPHTRPDCPLDPLYALQLTAADMRAIGAALGAYQVDNNVFPYFPSGTTIGPHLADDWPSYYSGTTRDAWGLPFRYTSTSSHFNPGWVTGYTLKSYGKDTVPGYTSSEFDSDILFVNGMFAAPERLRE